MARVRTGGAARYVQRASLSGEAYSTGVSSPRADWADATAASEETWKQGVQQAVAKKSFSSGVRRVGTSKWRSRALAVGRDRFVEGVTNAEAAYSSGVKPYLEVIEKTELPTRYPKGDPRNLNRVKAISEALHNKKING